MKKIPYGESHYPTLIQQGYVYVDKTPYIRLLEEYQAKYLFFLRPRRFGKTLFISILEHYYDNKNKEVFSELFGETSIGKIFTPLRNQYYILRFNFSGITTSTKEALLESFTQKVIESLEKFLEKYHFSVEYEKIGLPATIFNAFLSRIDTILAHYQGKIYVLIDEYDHFANELLSFQVETFEETVSKTGFVRKWYEILKEGTERGIVDRIFATGVSPVMLDSLTSGFNIALNLTRDRNLNAMLGFTEQEVKYLIQHTLPQPEIEADILPDLQACYNGYLFHEDAETRVFNSDMVLYYLTCYRTYQQAPKDLIYTNISSDYSKLRSLFTFKHKERNYSILQELLNGETPKATITREFSLAKRFTRDDFLSLLFYLGFLTIKEPGRGLRVVLDVPNYVIKELYFAFFEELLNQQVELELTDIIEGIEDIAFEGKIERFVKSIETLLEKLSFRDLIRFDEKYVKLLMLTYLMLSKLYYVKSEYEVESGYIDIALFARSSVSVEYEALIEVKYLSQKDYEDPGQGKQLLQQKIQQAQTQLKQYQQAEELRERPALKKWIVIFAGKTCVYVEEL